MENYYMIDTQKQSDDFVLDIAHNAGWEKYVNANDVLTGFHECSSVSEARGYLVAHYTNQMDFAFNFANDDPAVAYDLLSQLQNPNNCTDENIENMLYNSDCKDKESYLLYIDPSF